MPFRHHEKTTGGPNESHYSQNNAYTYARSFTTGWHAGRWSAISTVTALATKQSRQFLVEIAPELIEVGGAVLWALVGLTL
jgi:hypothetical protein